MITKISSAKNDLIKDIIILQTKSKERKLKNLTVIEGLKEFSIAQAANLKFHKILYCPNIIKDNLISQLLQDEYFKDTMFYELTPEIYSKISYRESTEGIISIAETQTKELNSLEVDDNSLFIILESVEKPGNLGAICRIADAAKVSGIIISDPLTDIYNPNIIRASLGCVFSNNIVVSDFETINKWLKFNKINLYATQLEQNNYYHNYNYKNKTAFIFGTEADGLTDKWLNIADYKIKIPMLGNIDSLNVATSVAITIFEAKRQRNFLV